MSVQTRTITRASRLVGTMLAAALLLGTLTVTTAKASTNHAGGPAKRPVAAARAATPSLDEAAAMLERLPLELEENHGQSDPSVRYLARGNGFTLFVTDTEAVTAQGGATVRMRFPKARRVTGEAPSASRTNYFLGDDPAKWQRDVPAFGRARLEGVFNGIDLVVYGTKDSPEYDFVVAPGADPGSIAYEIDGASSMRIDAQGDLVLKTSAGELRHAKPVIFQESEDGVRLPVSGAFELRGKRVGFRVGGYDASRTLVIDPVVRFATYLGGKDIDPCSDIAVDAVGNVYVTGWTQSRDFPLKNEYSNGSLRGDAYVTKFNANATAIIFSTHIGGLDFDAADAIALDASNRVFICGETFSGTFPTKNQYDGFHLVDGYDRCDAFLTVLTSAGDDLVYSTLIGSIGSETAFDVAVDIHGNAFIAGGTDSKNFPTKSPSNLPPFQQERADGPDIYSKEDGFVAKFDPDERGDTSLVYSTFLGGFGTDQIRSIAVDEFERAYVTGTTEATDFPVLNALQGALADDFDAFVTKFNADGTTVFFSTFLGGDRTDNGFGIALDRSAGGDPIPVVVGRTESDDFPVANAFQPTYGGGVADAWLAKLEGDGRSLIFSTYHGGNGEGDYKEVAVDTAGNVYAQGSALDETLPLVNPIPINGVILTEFMFVAKYTRDGTLVFSSFLADSTGAGIAVDGGGDVYVSGSLNEADLAVTPGVFQPNFGGASDSIIMKLDMVTDDTIATWKNANRTFSIRNSNLEGPPDLTVVFGATGDKPLSGDWNGDGVDTIGVYTPSRGSFAQRNSNTAGASQNTFIFGAPNLQPIKGDWDGDGDDTIGVYDVATGSFFLRNTNSKGGADITFTFGAPAAGFLAIAGDWDGDGVDTIGLYDPATQAFFLRNQNAGGNADLTFTFGPTGAKPVAGDWNGDGVDTVGTFSLASGTAADGLFSLINANAAGIADIVVRFTNINDLPVVGNWDGQ